MKNYAIVDRTTKYVLSTLKAMDQPTVTDGWLVEAPEELVAGYRLDQEAGVYKPPRSNRTAPTIPTGDFVILNPSEGE